MIPLIVVAEVIKTAKNVYIHVDKALAAAASADKIQALNRVSNKRVLESVRAVLAAKKEVIVLTDAVKKLRQALAIFTNANEVSVVEAGEKIDADADAILAAVKEAEAAVKDAEAAVKDAEAAVLATAEKNAKLTFFLSCGQEETKDDDPEADVIAKRTELRNSRAIEAEEILRELQANKTNYFGFSMDEYNDPLLVDSVNHLSIFGCISNKQDFINPVLPNFNTQKLISDRFDMTKLLLIFAVLVLIIIAIKAEFFVLLLLATVLVLIAYCSYLFFCNNQAESNCQLNNRVLLCGLSIF